MDKKDFAKIRRLLGKTQIQMAQLLDISPKAVQSFEQGWRNIPSHIAREMLLLKYLKKNHYKNAKPCWELKSCPDEWKKNCIVWELQIKNFCWYFDRFFCQGKIHQSWEVKMLVCRGCEMYKLYS